MQEPWKSAGKFLWRHWPSTLLVLGVGITLMTPHAIERFLVYYPMKDIEEDPSSVGLKYEDVHIVTEDHVRVHGWFVPCADADVTLLIFHGNAGNIGHRVTWIRMLHEAGAHALIIDYRGYGRSEGKPFEEGLYRDARAAYQWWSEKRKSTGEKLVLLGESLGGTVAADLATRHPVDGLILQSTFTCAWDMAKTLFPLGLLQPLTGINFDAAGKISGIRCPKLIIHGSRDEIVPPHLGKKLYDVAAQPKEFYEVPGAGHNDLPWAAGPEYVARIRRFLSQISRGREGRP